MFQLTAHRATAAARVAPVPTISDGVVWALALVVALAAAWALHHRRRGGSLLATAALLLLGLLGLPPAALLGQAEANPNAPWPMLTLPMAPNTEFGLPVTPITPSLFDSSAPGSIFLNPGSQPTSFIAKVFGGSDAQAFSGWDDLFGDSGAQLGDAFLGGIFSNQSQLSIDINSMSAFSSQGDGLHGIVGTSFLGKSLAAKAKQSAVRLCAEGMQLKPGERCLFLFTDRVTTH